MVEDEITGYSGLFVDDAGVLGVFLYGFYAVLAAFHGLVSFGYGDDLAVDCF